MRSVKCFQQCRLCLCNKKSMVEIFPENVKEEYDVKVAIEDLLDFKVLQSDGFPEVICNDCSKKVLGYKKFKDMCLKSREILWRKAMEKFREQRMELHDYYLQAIGYKESAEIDQAGDEQSDDDNISSVSTLIWADENENGLDFDEESIHLKLETCSVASETNSVQLVDELNNLPLPTVQEVPISTSCDYQLADCRVVLTRCDLEQYIASQKSSQTSDERAREKQKASQNSSKTSDESGNPFLCIDCQISFLSLDLLLKHKEYAHSGAMPEDVQVIELRGDRTNKTSARSYGKRQFFPCPAIEDSLQAETT
ncbi:uncharacterized protein [Hetaerina americana]|uniref:uncharacterized protein isoform X2 n=1 Tax=Hetaerina americana TaxID=62018 RepID=UPI003A7F3780